MVPSRRGAGRAKGDVKEKTETEPGCLHGCSGPPSEGASACCVGPGMGPASGLLRWALWPRAERPGSGRPATPWVVCRWRGRGGLAPVRFSRAAAQLQTLACTQRGFAPRRPECLGLCPGPRFLFLISTWTGAELWAAESVMVRSDWPLLQKAHPCLQRAHRGPRTRCSPAPFPTRAHERGPD